jgi:hypothetical protein
MSPRVGRTPTLPTVEPILLTPRVDPFDDPAWLFEPKWASRGEGASTSQPPPGGKFFRVGVPILTRAYLVA